MSLKEVTGINRIENGITLSEHHFQKEKLTSFTAYACTKGIEGWYHFSKFLYAHVDELILEMPYDEFIQEDFMGIWEAMTIVMGMHWGP